MDYAQIIRDLGRGRAGARNLSFDEARQFFGAMLDGRVPELELGAALIALRLKGESLDEMLGFSAALGERHAILKRPAGCPRPVILPSYNGARRGVNLTPLLALLIRRQGVPVLIHGPDEEYGRVTSARIFKELDVTPCASIADGERALDETNLAFLPVSAISPGLQTLLSLRDRLGLRNCAHSLVKLLDPFKGDGVVVAAASHPDYLDLMRDMIDVKKMRALLLRATEGEPYANPKRQPRIEYLHDGKDDVLFEAEQDSLKTLPDLPMVYDAQSTADWIRKVLAGEVGLPLPIANQLACCLLASGKVDDLARAQALVTADAGIIVNAHG